jgi:2-phosphosulfolactate phosphatase
MPVRTQLEIALLPRDLDPNRHLAGRAVVVFDVLRATTTMAAALDAGVAEIRIFGDTASALSAGRGFSGPHLLCGEEKCLPPPGFDLGNSPAAFTRAEHAGRVAFMSTTNGTRAILAARGAATIFTGALVNASAVAQALAATALPVTLLCAGTNGSHALEDLLGAGAVTHALRAHADIAADSDTVAIAEHLFRCCRSNLPEVLRQTRGGQNIIAAGLAPDIDFASTLDAVPVVGHITGDPPTVRRWSAQAAAMSSV